jgi:Rrf2 family protein
MRISARIDYAVRALAVLAAAPDGGPVPADDIAAAQDIPANFLLTILGELRRAHLVRSHRGREGGYELGRPADEITIADVARALEGPLANIRDVSLQDLHYSGPAASLVDVWRAVRTSLRDVLEHVTIADLANDTIPGAIRDKANEYEAEQQRRHPPQRARTPVTAKRSTSLR